MAKLSSCYPLCPLIDRSPIGVTPDSVPGCVIVTLGKNIVIRYKLADQKQASSWSSKDKLSAPVVYDGTGQQYVAVFNHSMVRIWNDTEVDLNKVKKVKFDLPIYAILNRNIHGNPVVVFKNGAAVSLSLALDDRKKLWRGHLSPEFSIKECHPVKLEGSECIAIVAVDESAKPVLVVVEIDGGKCPLLKIPLERAGKVLLGHTTMKAEESVSLITLWDDGQLFSLSLKKNISPQDGVGCALFSVRAVSSKNEVAMTQISTNHLAIYGSDPIDEGAMLVIVNTQFMLVQAHQHYKLFSNSSNLWTIGSSLLLVVGHSLAVVPFLLDTERLCALIGSHKPMQLPGLKVGEVEQVLEMESVSWDHSISSKEQDDSDNSSTLDVLDSQVIENYPETVQKLLAQGYSQAMLCEKLVPLLLDECKIPILLWLLKNLPDFPESALVHSLVFCLDASEDVFKEVNVGMHNGTDSNCLELDGEDSRDSQNNLVELSIGQRILLDVIIKMPFSEASILPHLRSRLNLPHCLMLLQYVAQSLPQTKSISNAQALLRWAAVLLDSHYQQLLLSKDECVSSTVTALKELVESHVEVMDDLKLLHPILERIKCGQTLQKPSQVTNKFYSIESLRLY